MKIDSAIIPLAYNIAKQVYDGELKQSVAIKQLASEAKMNVNSAADYINNLKLMLKGRRFQRTLNYASMDYYLENISSDYGSIFLRRALLALNQHILYYEEQGNGKTTAKKNRSLLEKYKIAIESPELIVDISHIKANIETLENFLTSIDPDNVADAQKLIKQGTCFIAYRINKEVRFAPSRYLGYKNNEPYKYLMDIDGRDTNKVISDILGIEPSENITLELAYIAYCTDLGFAPSSTGKFGVPRKYWLLDIAEDFVSNSAATEGFPEGKIVERMHRTKERSSKVIELAKQSFKTKNGSLFCQVCKFDYSKVYGELGDGFIEGHHTVWMSDMPADYKTKPEEIALLCANCHRMVHRRRPWLKINELNKILESRDE